MEVFQLCLDFPQYWIFDPQAIFRIYTIAIRTQVVQPLETQLADPSDIVDGRLVVPQIDDEMAELLTQFGFDQRIAIFDFIVV